jgi:hypothetical protein
MIDNLTVIEACLPQPSRFPACFAFSVHKSGSSLLSSMIEGVCELAKIPAISIPDLLFNAGVTDSEWRNDTTISRCISDGRIYFGFRYLPEFLCAPGILKDDNRSTLLVRDPRDALVSEYFSYGGRYFSHAMPVSGSVRAEEAAKATESLNIDQYVLSSAQELHNKLLMYRSQLNVDNLLLLRYENIFFEKQRFLRQIFDHFNIDVPSNILEDVAAFNDIRPAAEDPTKHIRKGFPGDHREKLHAETIRKLNDIFRDTCRWFGYDLDNYDILHIADKFPPGSK